MSSDSKVDTNLSQEKKALLALRRMKAKLDTIERKKTEPIAIVGVGCRFPGRSNDLEKYWKILHDGVDTATEIPADRWDVDAYYDPDPDVPGKMYTRWGCFIEQVDQFDSNFFGISPREAVGMDPQHRLMMEVSWETMENAGIVPSSLKGSSTGVFFGISNSDYMQQIMKYSDPSQIDTYFGTGNGPSLLSGRLSYTMDFHGPSITIDTACSSSLMAIHLACQSLRNDECEMAFAGAPNLILTPEPTIFFCQARALSPNKICRTFDAGADGYIRGEGCGIVLLKRLSDAISVGDNILAVIRSSAANHDGRSNGLTAPNQSAQEEVIREALKNANLDPSQVSYIEAHGTGTPLGDPIEIHALASVYGKGRVQENPLIIGSVKTNIGHVESAAGAASLIKVILALKHEKIPAHLHFEKLNPHIQADEFPFVIPTELIPWPAAEEKRIAGVSSFGFSGTNVHLLVEEAPENGFQRSELERTVQILTLSAKTEKALKESAGHYASYLSSHPDDSLADISHTANSCREHFEYRLATTASSFAALEENLSTFASGATTDAVMHGQVEGAIRPKIAFIFTGQGSQYTGMGKDLYETQPVFRKSLERCHDLLRSHLDKPLLSVIYPETGSESLLNETAYTQPALFALEYALSELWRSWGIEPSIVMGHSVGEYVAACVAGVFSLEHGLKLIVERGRLIQSLPGNGSMAAVFGEEALIREVVLKYRDTVSVAAMNGPSNTVISGTEDSVREVLQDLENKGIQAHPLTVSHAFHSHLMDPILDSFEKIAREVHFHPLAIPMVSNLLGRVMDYGEVPDANYWRRHIREGVRFSEDISALHEEGIRMFIEVGPKPTLLGMARECIPQEDNVWLPSLRKDVGDWEQMLESLGELYVRGAQIDWKGFDRDYNRRRMMLPTYPFQREHFWTETSGNKYQTDAPIIQRSALEISSHPLVHRKLLSALNDTQFESQFRAESLPYVKDHRFYGTPVFPGAGFLEMALEAGMEFFGSIRPALEDTVFLEALPIPDGEERTVQIILTPEDSDTASYKIFSLVDEGAREKDAWRLNVTGKVVSWKKEDQGSGSVSIPEIKARCTEELSVQEYYQRIREVGVDYGLALQGIKHIQRGQTEALGQIQIPEFLEAEVDEYQLHPVLLDSCFQLVGAIFLRDMEQEGEYNIYIPFSLDNLKVYKKPGSVLWGYASILDEQGVKEETVEGIFRLYDETGILVAEVEGLQLKRVSRESLLRSTQKSMKDCLYEFEWRQKEIVTGEVPSNLESKGKWLIFSDAQGHGDELVRELERKGEEVVQVFPNSSFQISGENRFDVDPMRREDFKELFKEAFKKDGAQCIGIVHLWSLDTLMGSKKRMGALDYQALTCGSILHLIQTLSSNPDTLTPRLWLFTSGAQEVGDLKKEMNVFQAPLWGMGRVIAMEHPDMKSVLIDLDPNDSGNWAEQLSSEILTGDRENQISYLDGFRYVPRLVRYPLVSEDESSKYKLHADASYLITGGLGGLGLKVALRLADIGAKNLVLMGRTAPGAKALESIARIEKKGASVTVAAGDVTKQDDVQKILDDIESSGKALRGIIHAAGILDDGILKTQDWEQFERVLSPKLQGAWNLHILTQDFPLDFFVCFSSIASIFGSQGQGNYAAANAFLDALAHYRRVQGLPGLAINWGPWGEIGMAASLSDREQDRWASQGVGMIQPEQGLDMLTVLMGRDISQITVMSMNWDKFLQWLPANEEPSYLLDIVETIRSQADTRSAVDESDTFLSQFHETDPEDKYNILMTHVRKQVMKTLRLKNTAELKADKGLTDLGMDSLMAIEITNRLKLSLGCSLPSTLVFEHPTISALTDHLATEVMGFDEIDSGFKTEDSAESVQLSIQEEVENLSEEDAEETLFQELERTGY